MTDRPDRRRTAARGLSAGYAHGFTLIEVLIAVAIVGIIAAIAVPSYGAYLTKTRRSDATIFLLEAAGEQLRHRSEFNAFTADLTELGYPQADDVRTAEGHYTVSAAVIAGSPERFVLTATPAADGPQASDAECTSLTLDSNGVRGSTGAGADCW